MSADLTTFSFPLRSLGVSETAAPKSARPGKLDSPFLLRRFHGDQQNRLIKRWCDSTFMADRQSPWPLVLYGPAGTGKSALAETLACRLKLQCTRVTSDDFRRQFHAAVATRSTGSFQQRMQSSEMLVLDNLSFPEDESALIREFVQLVDFYRVNHRPLIITTRQVPYMLGPGFNQLRSRLVEGLTIEVRHPGPDAKREIASEILSHFDLKIIDEDLDWLVRSLPETAPLIKSFLAKVALETDDTLLTRASLKRQQSKSNRSIDPLAIQKLIKLVARQLGQRVSEITGKTRRKEVVRARSVSMFLARDLLSMTFRQIGDCIGKRDPSTVRHACSQIKNAITNDSNMAEVIKQVTSQFASYQMKHGTTGESPEGKTC